MAPDMKSGVNILRALELPDGRVYDPNRNEYMPKAENYSRYKPSECLRFTRMQAAKLIVDEGHWGPWTESERPGGEDEAAFNGQD